MQYRVFPLSPERHIFAITATLENVSGTQQWQLPAWVPGSYMIRDFARHIVHIKAEAGGEALAITKLDKHTWQTAAPAQTASVSVTIEVHAHDTSVRAAFLDNRYGFFDGASVFLRALGREEVCQLDVQPPADSAYDSWTLATGLNPVNTDARGFGTFAADDYDSLIDHPVLMGKLETVQFDVDGVPHSIVLNGRQRADTARLTRDVQKICATQAALFGELPMQQYLFLTHVSGSAYGGLEHRNSSTLACPRKTLPRHNEAADKVRDGYRTLMGLFSHEYFHSWNVKRIKPAAFTPYDLTKENYTELLWAFEGITSYYDNLGLVRAGVISAESYLELLGQDITRVARSHGRHRQTVTESSFDAWTRFYKQDSNAPNAIISYYVKGALVALALDLTLRKITQGQKSLDDVMRLLWQRYGRDGTAGRQQGVPEKGIQPLAEEVAGQSLEEFFQKALYSTDDIGLTELLAPLGVQLHWRGANGHADKGGKPGESTLHLGAMTAKHSQGVKLRVLYEQGIAMQAGLAPGDILIAIDYLKVTNDNLDDTLASFSPGDKVRLHAFRDDELMQYDVVLQPSANEFAWLEIAKDGLTDAGKAWLLSSQ